MGNSRQVVLKGKMNEPPAPPLDRRLWRYLGTTQYITFKGCAHTILFNLHFLKVCIGRSFYAVLLS